MLTAWAAFTHEAKSLHFQIYEERKEERKKEKRKRIKRKKKEERKKKRIFFPGTDEHTKYKIPVKTHQFVT